MYVTMYVHIVTYMLGVCNYVYYNYTIGVSPLVLTGDPIRRAWHHFSMLLCLSTKVVIKLLFCPVFSKHFYLSTIFDHFIKYMG